MPQACYNRLVPFLQTEYFDRSGALRVEVGMTKKDEQKAKLTGNSSGKSRMKVFVAGFDMEGSDDTMAEGFKAIRELAASISRGTILPPALALKSALGTPKPPADSNSAAEEEAEQPV